MAQTRADRKSATDTLLGVVCVGVGLAVPTQAVSQEQWRHPRFLPGVFGSPGAACAAGETPDHKLIGVFPTGNPHRYTCLMRARPPLNTKHEWGTHCLSNCRTPLPPDDPCETVGNPVDPLTGSKHEIVVDYQREAEGLAVRRIFRSQSSHLAGRIGPRWSLDVDRVMTLTSTAASITTGTGTRLDYTKGQTGPYIPAANTPWRYVNRLQYMGSTHYQFRDLDGRVDVFKQIVGSDYRLERSTERSGYSKTFIRDAAGFLERVEDNRGMSLTLAWSVSATGEKQMVTGVTVSTDAASTADDLVVSYGYNPAIHDPDPAVVGDEIAIPNTGTLARVEIQAAGMGGPEVTQYHYENTTDPTLLTGITDARGVRVSTYAYDALGRVTLSERAGQQFRHAFAYDDVARINTVTNPLGKVTRYHYSLRRGRPAVGRVEGMPSANCLAANAVYGYDSYAFVTSMTDEQGRVTTYEYDSRGREISRVEASGTPEARTITTEWHHTHDVRTRIIEPGRTTRFEHDDQGRLIGQTETDTSGN